MKRKRDVKELDAAPRAAAKPKSILKGAKKAKADKAYETDKKAVVSSGWSSKKVKLGDKKQASGERAAAATAAAAASKPSLQDTSIVTLGDAPATIQIIAGSYDRTLHGVTATIVPGTGEAKESVHFADTFLFNAHASAIRCLALSPPSVPVPGQAQRVMLATGSTDERINIYNLTAHPPLSLSAALDADGADGADEAAVTAAGREEEKALLASVGLHRPLMATAQNSKNRELGTLLHHASTVTQLAFPTRSKLLSASEDSTIAVTRTRDWSLLSSIKAPIPMGNANNAAGAGGSGAIRRPSGDTAAPGATPSGVNSFAVHPSMKVMLSVSRGERCMRLWNLVTGKKAGVLNFGRELLREVGEDKLAISGEGRQVQWGRSFSDTKPNEKAKEKENETENEDENKSEEPSDEFAIGFDRNVVVFGMDSLPRCKVLADARTKTHDFHYLEVDNVASAASRPLSLLAVATEDGRILLCSTLPADLVANQKGKDEDKDSDATGRSRNGKRPSLALPCARIIGQMGGKALGITGRVKAFKVLSAMEPVRDKTEREGREGKKARQLQKVWYVVAASSTGALRVWRLTGAELRQAVVEAREEKGEEEKAGSGQPVRQVGQLLGMYQTADRITCVEAFVMIPRPEGWEESEDEEEEEDEGEDEDDEDED